MSLPPSDKRPDEEPRADLESPDEPGATDDPKRATWWDRVEAWRRLMLGGALILLATSAVRAGLKDDLPDSVLLVATFAGYLLLVFGFARFFRDRRKR